MEEGEEVVIYNPSISLACGQMKDRRTVMVRQINKSIQPLKSVFPFLAFTLSLNNQWYLHEVRGRLLQPVLSVEKIGCFENQHLKSAFVVACI